MTVAKSSEALLTTYQTTRKYIATNVTDMSYKTSRLLKSTKILFTYVLKHICK